MGRGLQAVALNRNSEGLSFVDGLIDNDENVASKKHAQLKTRVLKLYHI